MPETAPRRVVRQHRCDLGEREHEHEIEEEFERRYALLTLSVQLTHRRTLAPTDRDCSSGDGPRTGAILSTSSIHGGPFRRLRSP